LVKGKPREPAEGFCGYPAATFAFFRGLAANNEKPWFEANRASYESAVKAATGDLIDAVSHALRAQDLPLEGDRKRSGFRIHRDVRFSKDKRPYKTAAGVVWYRQGSGKDGAGILYFHLDPGACFAAAAFYLPDPEVLGAIRERIRVHPDRFLSMQARLGEAGLTLDASDTLTRMPRGFEDLAGAETAPPSDHRQGRAIRRSRGQDRPDGHRRPAAAAVRLDRHRRRAQRRLIRRLKPSDAHGDV
jgi:uncharacterized protein (TIGR02453 family)